MKQPQSLQFNYFRCFAADGAAYLGLAAILFFCPPVAIARQSEEGFFETVVSQAQPKMAKVFGASAGNVEGFATGIVVSAQGHVLSTQGVFLDGQQVRVILANGSEHQATILRRDRVTQLALLKIETATPDYFELNSEPIGAQGDWVIALTNAFKVADKDEPLSATLGVISLRTTIEARLNRRDVAYQGELVVIDAITSNPGAAGGAVLTTDGQLVGMVGKIINSSETNTRLNYAVPSSILAKFVANPDSAPVTAVAEVSPLAELGIIVFKTGGRNNPAYIDRVRPNSPAAAAELKSDDMIVSIAGQKIGTVKEFNEAVDTLHPGEEVILVIKRGTEFLRVPIVPELRK